MGKPKILKEQKEFTAPDGGWGWMVVLGVGISSTVLISVLQTFGLMFKNRFDDLEFSVTDTTSLMSINSSFGMVLGILNGPLLKRFGYRKIALVGSTLFVSGFYYTAFSRSYIEFLFCYGMISSLGTSMSMASFSLALNTYFKLKRSIASSLSVTITGIGPILLPLLITELLSSYGWRWAVLITAAITMNTFVGALLLQPIKWHVRGQKIEEIDEINVDATLDSIHQPAPDSSSLFGLGSSFLDFPEILGGSHSELSVGKWRSQNSLQKCKTSNYLGSSKISLNKSNGQLNKKLPSITSLDNEDYGNMMKSTLYILESSTPKGKPVKCASTETLEQKSISTSPYESEWLLNEKDLDVRYAAADASTMNGDIENNGGDESHPMKSKGVIRKMIRFFKKMYDLDLLLDPVYINLLLGLSIATVGEIIFSLLTPFIVTELGLSLDETALFMSVIAMTDVVFRFLSPYFGNFLKLGSRMMYIISISILLITRACLLFAKTFSGFLAVAVMVGVGKGFRTVYWTLVVPDYVPLNKLASAVAFQSLSNGISLLISGPIIGIYLFIYLFVAYLPIIGAVVANSDNKYVYAIFAANCLTLTTIIMWGIEFIVTYRKKRVLKSLTVLTVNEN